MKEITYLTVLLLIGLLLMDEPFSALDYPLRLGMQKLLLKLWRVYQPAITLSLLFSYIFSQSRQLNSNHQTVFYNRTATIQGYLIPIYQFLLDPAMVVF